MVLFFLYIPVCAPKEIIEKYLALGYVGVNFADALIN